MKRNDHFSLTCSAVEKADEQCKCTKLRKKETNCIISTHHHYDQE